MLAPHIPGTLKTTQSVVTSHVYAMHRHMVWVTKSVVRIGILCRGRYRSRTPGSVLHPHCENFKDSERAWGCPPQSQWTPGSKGPGFSPLWTLPFSIWSLLHCLGPQNHTWPSVPPFFLAFLPLLTSDKVTVCVGALPHLQNERERESSFREALPTPPPSWKMQSPPASVSLVANVFKMGLGKC